MSVETIPKFYKGWFLWFDPISTISGAYMDFFTPAVVMAAYNPSAVHTRTQDVLFQQLGAAYIMIAFLSTFLLRHSKDLKVWQLYQTSVLLFDVAIVYSFYDTLKFQGRLSLDKWEAGDWGDVTICVMAVVCRSCFLLGVGFGDSAKSKRI